MKRDPTYSTKDVVRIWTKYLTADEREEVRCFFLALEAAKKNPRGLNFLFAVLAVLFGAFLEFGLLEGLLVLLADILPDLLPARECLKRVRERAKVLEKGPPET